MAAVATAFPANTSAMAEAIEKDLYGEISILQHMEMHVKFAREEATQREIQDEDGYCRSTQRKKILSMHMSM